MRRGPLRRPAALRTVAAVAAPAVLAVLALVHPGQPVSRLDLHDGGVWLTNAATLQVGRWSSTVDELNGGLVAASERLDVLQDGGDVLLVEPGSVSAVDPASVTTTATVPVPPGSQVTMADGTVSVLDPADGSLWAGTVDRLAGLRTDGPPTVELGAGAVAAVTVTGAVLTESADGARAAVTVSGADVVVDRAAAPGDGGTGPHAAERTATAVGDALVTLSGATLRTPAGPVDLSGHGSPLVLQQPGPAAGSVLVAAPTALLEVPLDGGAVRSLPSGGSGRPAAPVRVGTCAHAAWATATGSYLTRCDGDRARTLDLEGVTGSDALVFRVNRSVVVLNDTARGRLWIPTEDAALHAPNWESVEPEPQHLEGEPDADTPTSDSTPLADCAVQDVPPTAVDDEFGVRPGRSTVLPVLDNDAASDCGTLVISDVDPLPASLGTLTAVHGDRALQLTPADGATGTATFTYTVSDGRGSSAPSTATVRVTIRPEGADAPPVQVRVPTLVVEQGAAASVDVLPGFADPDGDDLVLVAAATGDAGDDPARVRFRADGTVTFTAPAIGRLGHVTVHLQVSDGTRTTDGVLDVDVRPAGSVVPVLDPVHAVTQVDVPVTVRPLDAVRSGSLEAVRLAGVDPLDGLTVVPDLAAGTFTVTAPRAGTYYVTFLVAAAPQTATGVARVDVRERVTEPGVPVAVPDRALLPPPDAEVTVDPLANDVDPAGGVLVLRSVEVPEGSGLSVATLGHGLLRIAATRQLDGPVVVRYLVSNGAATALGEVLVRPVPPAAASVPVVPDVEASVRTGGVVTIPVLDDAYDADGQTLTLVRDLAQPLPEGHGLLFASGDVLRYRAPERPLTVRTTFAVRDPDGNEVTAILTVHVHAADAGLKAPPRPEPVTARVFVGETVRIPVPLVGIDPDGDGVTLLGLGETAPAKGRITAVGADWLEYEALPDTRGTDTFTYAVEDWVGQRAVATVRVGIAERPAQDAGIVARPDTVVVQPGRTVEVRVLANDVDPAGEELLLGALRTDDLVEARVEGRRVVVRAPDRPGVVHLEYTVSTPRGVTATAVLSVDVREDAPALPPVARDVVVPPVDTVDRTEVRVDVLAVADNPNGPMSELAVSVHPSAGEVTRVGADGAVVVTLAESAQTLPYVLTHVPSGLSTLAFVTVPARGDFPPMLRPRAPALTVLAGEPLVIPLAEQIQVAPGRTAQIVDESRVSATKADGSPLVVDRFTLAYRAPRTYAGPASISMAVTDSVDGEAVPRTRVLTLPITVLAVEDHPPTFRASTIEVAQGEPEVTVDLTAFTTAPLGAAGAGELRYALASAVPSGFVVDLSGSTLRVGAPPSAPRGTLGSLALTVALGDGPPAEGRLELRVTASRRPLARPAALVVTDAVEDRARAVDVLEGAYNPFPGTPLTVVGAAVQTPGAGTASMSGGTVAVRPAAGFIGTLVVRYSLRDATGDPAREVDGTVTVTVRGRPATPAPARVVEVRDRAAVLAWDAPAANGEPITAYRVTASQGGVVTECPATTCTIGGLTNDTEYTFTVAARNAVDWSADSAPSAPVRPDAQPEAPAAPTVAAGDRELTASWSAPRSPGSPVDRYTVEVSPAPPAGAVLTTTATAVTVRNLTNGVQYLVRVRAHNRAPEPGAWSPWSTGAVPAAAPAAPSPTATRHDAGGFTAGGRIDVAWAAPSANGAALAAYEVAVDGATVATVPASSTSWTFDGAERGRRYTIAVRARNAVGWSAWGSTPGETWSAPSEPRGATATDGGSGEVPWGQGVVVLAWEPPADTGGTGITVAGYEVEGRGRTTATSVTVGGLVAGATPAFRVRAWSSREEASAWVTIAPTTVTTAPAAPEALRADRVAGDRVQLEWLPGATGGSAVTGFRYRLDGGAWVDVARDVTRVTADAGPAARVEVQARNARGWSPVAGAPVTERASTVSAGEPRDEARDEPRGEPGGAAGGTS